MKQMWLKNESNTNSNIKQWLDNQVKTIKKVQVKTGVILTVIISKNRPQH